MKCIRTEEKIITLENVKEVEIFGSSKKNKFFIKITYWNKSTEYHYATSELEPADEETVKKQFEEIYKILSEN